MSERIYQVIIGVLVLVVIVGGWMMIASRRAGTSTTMGSVSTSTSSDSDDTDASGDSDSDSDTDTSSSYSNSTMANDESVMADDQAAGASVTVDSVALTKRGWVAIEDAREWILGAARLEAGTHKDVTIDLLRGTKAGESYKVVVFVDDGDGAFDLHKDTMIKNSDGSTLSAAFIAK